MSDDGMRYVAVELVMRAALLGEDGGTVSVGGLSLPETGYYVGGVVPTLGFGSRGEVRFPEVLSFLETSGTSYVGFWVDQEDGRVHFDAVDWYEWGTLAETVGASRGEIAIWDIRNNCEVRLNVTSARK